jgi:hypothetical protein
LGIDTYLARVSLFRGEKLDESARKLDETTPQPVEQDAISCRFLSEPAEFANAFAQVSGLVISEETSLTATTALDRQIERHRQMTGEQRLAVALDLHEMSCDIAREGIRCNHPTADPAPRQ